MSDEQEEQLEQLIEDLIDATGIYAMDRTPYRYKIVEEAKKVLKDFFELQQGN